jgi:hypothetical protein
MCIRDSNNIGLLISTFGKVTYSSGDYCYIDDGSALDDGSGHAGVRVVTDGFAAPPAGSFVRLKGISACYASQDKLHRLLRVPQQDWISYIGGAIISGTITKPQTVSASLQSSHPYSNYMNTTWPTITAPAGTTKMRLHFSRLAIAAGYDYLLVKNASNTTLAVFNSVNLYDYWTDWFNTSTVKLNLITDASVTTYGFVLDGFQTNITSPAAGVTVTLTPTAQTAVTSAEGTYSFVVPAAGAYTITPSLTGSTFTPASRTVPVSAGAQVVGVDFVMD